MVGIYLSGTGNTKHCIETLVARLDSTAATLPLEAEAVLGEIEKNSVIILGYPTQYSNAPYMVRDFITRNRIVWKGKKILCVATMGAFSGDGAGCTARLLKKYGATILGGLHLERDLNHHRNQVDDPELICLMEFLLSGRRQRQNAKKKNTQWYMCGSCDTDCCCNDIGHIVQT